MPCAQPELASKPFEPEGPDVMNAFIDRCCNRCALLGSASPCCNILLEGMTAPYEPKHDFPKQWTHNEHGQPTCTVFEEKENSK